MEKKMDKKQRYKGIVDYLMNEKEIRIPLTYKQPTTERWIVMFEKVNYQTLKFIVEKYKKDRKLDSDCFFIHPLREEYCFSPEQVYSILSKYDEVNTEIKKYGDLANEDIEEER